MKNKKFTWKHALTIFLVICLLICVALVFSIAVGNMHFLRGTTINGYDVSGKMLADVVDEIVKEYQEKELSIIENEEVIFSEKISEIGYKVDKNKLKDLIREEMDKQKDEVFLPFLEGKAIEIEIPYIFDDEEFRERISETGLGMERVESVNAELVFRDGIYQIEKEIYGTKLNEELLQEKVKTEMDANMNQIVDVEIELTKDLYPEPAVKSDDAELNRKMNAYNKYCQAKITYVFGNEKVVLDWETIQNWVVMDGENVQLSAESVTEYVDDLRKNYNTIYNKRSFTNSHGAVIQLPSNDYGYRIDRQKEIEQLTQNINANTAVEREPIYSHRGYHRNGKDDVLGCYIEVDLTNQHIWLYKDSKLIVEGDIVTGDPGYQETTTGAFPIAFKKSPYNLKGATWNTNVTYWMPFHDGQGLHDATWRNSFGGEIYKTNGSHGCVNLPFAVAQKIYETIAPSYPIFLYK